jgi:capsule polysaccharide export protein KpsE/RkpR
MTFHTDVIADSEQELEARLFVDQREEAYSQPAEQVGISLVIARILWDQRAFVGQWAVRGFLIATVMVLLIPNRYASTTSIMPPENQGGSGLAMIAALASKTTSPAVGGLASDLLGGKTSGALFMDVLHSRTVEDRIINRFDLRKVYWDRYMLGAREDLEQNTSVSEDRKSGVITISVSDRNAGRAKDLTHAYVEELDRLMNEVSTSSARRERMFIEQRLITVKEDMHQAADAFSQFASQNMTLDVKAQTKAMVEGAAALQGQLIAAQSQLEGLEQIYTDQNVRVRSLRARVGELKNDLREQQVGGKDAGLPGDDRTSSMLYPSIRTLPLLGVRWAELYEAAKVQETVYELLTQQYELAKIQEAKEIPTVKVIDDAVVPEKKSFPPRLGLMVMGTLLGLAAGAAWVCCAAFWEAIEPDDPAKSFALEVVGTERAWVMRKRQQTRSFFSRRRAHPPSEEPRNRDD